MLEVRTVTTDFEVREESSGPVLDGYAATFDDPYQVGPFTERVASSAFNRTLANGPDVRLLVDHKGQPLARTKSGTLQLRADGKGLRATATLDQSDPDVQRLIPKLRRGDLDQMSFAFRVPDGGDEWSDDFSQRTLREVSLAGGDVSVVTYPANDRTSVSVRALDARAARCTFVEAVVRELREGKTVSAANMARLRTVLDELAKADDALHAAEAAVAEIIGVPDPDTDDGTARSAKAPYGDVHYADPGYQKDGQKRYPLDTAEHVRAAWSYINQSDNAAKYSAEDLQKVRAAIKAAASKFGIQIGEGKSLRYAQALVERLGIPA